MTTNREITSTTAAQFLPRIWASDTRDAITHAEVLSKLVNTQYEDEMRIGRNLRIPLRSNLNTQTKSEGLGSTVSFQAFTEIAQNIEISTYQYAAQLLNEVVNVQSKYNERQRITKSLGYALMRGIEVTIATLFGSFSQIVGTLGADPDDAIIRRAGQYLADASVFDGAAYVWGPAAVYALFGNDKFTSKDYVNKPVIETAQLPMLYSYNSFQSNLLANPATGQTNCALLHKEAIILIRQIKPTVKHDYLIEHLAEGIVAFDLYNASEATWVDEIPAGDSPGSTGDYGAVLIRTG